VAITAFARKLITIIYHLLINPEPYQENNCTIAASKPIKKDLLYLSKEERFKDGVAAIVDAFYHLKNRSSEGGG
jgi:hypothetical protein